MWPPLLLTSASAYNAPTPESADSVDRWYHTHLRCVALLPPPSPTTSTASALRSGVRQGVLRPSFSAWGRWRWLALGCSGRGQTTLRTATVAACRGIGKTSESTVSKQEKRDIINIFRNPHLIHPPYGREHLSDRFSENHMCGAKELFASPRKFFRIPPPLSIGTLRKSAENPGFRARVSFFCPRLRFFTQDRPFCMARELILATIDD